MVRGRDVLQVRTMPLEVEDQDYGSTALSLLLNNERRVRTVRLASVLFLKLHVLPERGGAIGVKTSQLYFL